MTIDGTILFLLIVIVSCATPYKSKAPIWLHDSIPMELCNAETFKFGLYRVVSCKQTPKAIECEKMPSATEYEEFVPYCDPQVKNYLGIKASDVEKIVE